jgi:hypothetical protein
VDDPDGHTPSKIESFGPVPARTRGGEHMLVMFVSTVGCSSGVMKSQPPDAGGTVFDLARNLMVGFVLYLLLGLFMPERVITI